MHARSRSLASLRVTRVLMARRDGVEQCSTRTKEKSDNEANASSYTSSQSKSFLCLAGFFRLSATTRVTAGDKPEFRARRRASTPLSSFSLRLRFIPNSHTLRNHNQNAKVT